MVKKNADCSSEKKKKGICTRLRGVTFTDNAVIIVIVLNTANMPVT